MEDIFEDYRSFDSLETARFVLLDLLEQNQIPYTIYKDNNRQDVILGKGLSFSEVWVRLLPADVERVNRLSLQDAQQSIDAVPADYYLRELSDEELLDILKKPDAWSADDYLVASKILKEHGIDVSERVMAKWREDRTQEVSAIKKEELLEGSRSKQVFIFVACMMIIYIIVKQLKVF